MSFGEYTVQGLKITAVAALALGLLCAMLVISNGGMDGKVNLTFELSVTDALFLPFVLPVVVVLLFGVLSPLSYLLYWFMRRALGRNV